MRARWIGEGIGTYASLTQTGDVAIGAENYHRNLMVRCPICDHLHVVPIDGSRGWRWDTASLTLMPSVKVESHRGICHWTLTQGVFTIHPDSTARCPS